MKCNVKNKMNINKNTNIPWAVLMPQTPPRIEGMSIPFGDILTRNILTARYKNMNYKELRASFTPMRDDMFISNAQILKICGIK